VKEEKPVTHDNEKPVVTTTNPLATTNPITNEKPIIKNNNSLITTPAKNETKNKPVVNKKKTTNDFQLPSDLLTKKHLII